MKTEANTGMRLRAKEHGGSLGGAGAIREDSDPEHSGQAGRADTLILEFSRTVREYMCCFQPPS